jgi:hypothetical protein
MDQKVGLQNMTPDSAAIIAEMRAFAEKYYAEKFEIEYFLDHAERHMEAWLSEHAQPQAAQEPTDADHYRMQADALEAHLNSSMQENCRLREQIAALEATDGERLAFLTGVEWCAKQLADYKSIGNGDPERPFKEVYALCTSLYPEGIGVRFDPENGDASELFEALEEFVKREARSWRESAPRFANKVLAMSARTEGQGK